jgi:capsular polysaccharide biosynthesis protein
MPRTSSHAPPQVLPDAIRLAPALPRVLLIQRRSGDARRLITQFSDLKASAHGIDVVALEGVSLAFQVQLFFRYQTVAMMHGAALANFIWLRPGALLIDMRPSELEPWPDHPWPHGYSSMMS